MLTTKPAIPKPFLEFKFNQVVMLGDLGDGVMHATNIPTTMEQVKLPLESRVVRNPSTGRLEARAEYVTQPTFNLDHVHRIELKPELAVLPRRLPGMSDAHHSKLADGCYERATEAKAYNDRIREKVYHYVDSGVLTLVSDPFDSRDDAVIEGLTDESAAPITDSKPTNVKPRKKPTRKAA